MVSELRVAVTILPVGPRKLPIKGTSRWFAVQIAAGYDEQPAENWEHWRDNLWPWKLLDSQLSNPPLDLKVELKAWRVPKNQAEPKVSPEVAPGQSVRAEHSNFSENLRIRVVNAYQGSSANDIDLRLIRPWEKTGINDYDPQKDFPARLQYLATLPGSVAQCLAATVYVEVSADHLLDGQNPPQLFDEILWITPLSIKVGATVYKFDGKEPTVVNDGDGNSTNTYQVGYDTNGAPPLKVISFGPGFNIKRLESDTVASGFDFNNYWINISSGDSRFADVEELLRRVFDPFAAIRSVPEALIQSFLRLDEAPKDPSIPIDVTTAIRDLLLVREFVLFLQTKTIIVNGSKEDGGGLYQLLSLLGARLNLSHDQIRLIIKSIPDILWVLESASLVSHIGRIAECLNIPGPVDRAMVGQVAGRMGYPAITEWLARAFDIAFNATAGLPPDSVKAWNFSEDLPELSPVEKRRWLSERQQALAGGVVLDFVDAQIATKIKMLIGESAKNLRDKSKDELVGQWISRLRSVLANVGVGTEVRAALSSIEPPYLRIEQLLKLLDEDFKTPSEQFAKLQIDSAYVDQPSGKPELPGRGMTLLIGCPGSRLIHEDAQPNSSLLLHRVDQNTSVFGELSGIALFGRRGSAEADLSARPWHLLTGGVVFAGELEEGNVFDKKYGDEKKDFWIRDELLPVPIRPVFRDKVFRADVEYHGAPMSTESPLKALYREKVSVAATPAPAFTYQSIGAYKDNSASDLGAMAELGAALALRYGDWYQFKGGLVDQAGGLPSEIARTNDEPWRLSLKIEPDQIPQDDPNQPPSKFQYLRAVPVGEINVTPQEIDECPHWPQIPTGVALRSKEWLRARGREPDAVPALLVSEKQADGSPRLRSTVSNYKVSLRPPSTDEFTLVRWGAPALALADQDKAKRFLDLSKAWSLLIDERDKPPVCDVKTIPVHDPAVVAVGIRVQGFDESGNPAGNGPFVCPIKFEVDGTKSIFTMKPVMLNITGGKYKDQYQCNCSGLNIDLTVPEGCFVCIEICALVAKEDFSSRFDGLRMQELLDTSQNWKDYIAFKPLMLLVEGASDLLPKASELYEGFRLSVDKDVVGVVNVTFQKQVKHLQFVDTFTIERQRWTWRNRPLVYDELVENIPSDDERRRRLASGPPCDVLEPGADKKAVTQSWEAIAGLDRAFVSRGEKSDRWPREVSTSKICDGTDKPVLLLSDTLDDLVDIAAYLRYRLSVRSRYAPVLDPALANQQAKGEERDDLPDQSWRRTCVGFRGQFVKPPKVLSVIPLTRTLAEEPLPSTHPDLFTTPFLLVLDEEAYREYGLGERIEVRLALENLDISENTQRFVPRRVGKLSDHYLCDGTNAFKENTYENEEQNKGNPVLLDVFGPFGHTLDISPDEALANASTYVVYPPPLPDNKSIGARWVMFVRARRVLDAPSDPKKMFSQFSDSFAVYTRPNSRRLVRPMLDSDVSERMATLDTATPKLTLAELEILLDPTPDPIFSSRDPRKNSVAFGLYRYYLLVSELVRDPVQDVETEKPVALYQFAITNGNEYPKADSCTVEFKSGSSIKLTQLGDAVPDSRNAYRGRVLEVKVNGQYDKETPLDAKMDFFDFWRNVVLAHPESGWPGKPDDLNDRPDAQGVIEVLSDAFRIIVTGSNIRSQTHVAGESDQA
ncbi:MAG: hypothetical protein U1F34_03685 [Gammaproteobacteria bacterium]